MSSSSKLPILFSFWGSSCSWRVRIALHLKGIPFKIQPVDILNVEGGEQYTEEFEEINPMRHVPALRIDGTTLIDSLNILYYLEETRPEKSLLPDELVQRVRMREICHIVAAGIQPLQNIGVLNHLGKDNSKFAWAQHWINRGFTALEKILSKTSGAYCIGDKITLADCCIIPQIYNARRYKVDMEPYPNIVRIEKKFENHPDFLHGHPLRQPDCPKVLRI